MKVGDLIKECDCPELGLLVKIKEPYGSVGLTPCGVMYSNGKIQWLSKAYIEEKCEVISEAR